MKKNEGLRLIATLLFIVIFASMTAFAETKCPDCRAVLNTGATPHDASHSINDKMSNLDNTYHCPVCFTCYIICGHNPNCPQVVRVSEKTKHTLKEVAISSTKVQMQCTDCDYKEEAKSSCKHTDIHYRYVGPGTHYIDCYDCRTTIGEEACSYGAPEPSGTYQGEVRTHKYTCSKCGIVKTENHTDKVTYTPYTRGANYLANGMGSGSKHEKITTCTVCGFKQPSNIGYGEDHSFKGNVCTKCGFKKVILPKPKNGKGKQTKVKIKKGVRAAYTEYDSTWKKWRHYPALKYTDHYYTIKLTWGKVKDAKGYFVSDAKDRAGQANVGGYTPNDTTKTSITMVTSVRNKTLKKKVYYVYPVNADGIYGTPAKITTNLHG